MGMMWMRRDDNSPFFPSLSVLSTVVLYFFVFTLIATMYGERREGRKGTRRERRRERMCVV